MESYVRLNMITNQKPYHPFPIWTQQNPHTKPPNSAKAPALRFIRGDGAESLSDAQTGMAGQDYGFIKGVGVPFQESYRGLFIRISGVQEVGFQCWRAL